MLSILKHWLGHAQPPAVVAPRVPVAPAPVLVQAAEPEGFEAAWALRLWSGLLGQRERVLQLYP